MRSVIMKQMVEDNMHCIYKNRHLQSNVPSAFSSYCMIVKLSMVFVITDQHSIPSSSCR